MDNTKAYYLLYGNLSHRTVFTDKRHVLPGSKRGIMHFDSAKILRCKVRAHDPRKKKVCKT